MSIEVVEPYGNQLLNEALAYRPFGRKILLCRSEIDRVLAEKRINIDIADIVNDVMRELEPK